MWSKTHPQGKYARWTLLTLSWRHFDVSAKCLVDLSETFHNR